MGLGGALADECDALSERRSDLVLHLELAVRADSWQCLTMGGASRGKTGPLASLRATRGELWLFLLGGLLLAFAVNLVSDAVGNVVDSPGAALGVGLGCVLLGVVLLFLSTE